MLVMLNPLYSIECLLFASASAPVPAPALAPASFPAATCHSQHSSASKSCSDE